MLNAGPELEGFSVGLIVVSVVWDPSWVVFVVCEGANVVNGSVDVCVVEYICVVVATAVDADNDTVLVCTNGGDAVDVVVMGTVGVVGI